MSVFSAVLLFVPLMRVSGQYGQFKTPQDVTYDKMLPEQKKKAQAAMIMPWCDYDNDAKYNFDEFVCNSLFKQIVVSYDLDKDLHIHSEEIALIADLPEYNPEGLAVEDLFEMLDSNGNGKLDHVEFAQMLCSHNEDGKCTESDLRTIQARATGLASKRGLLVKADGTASDEYSGMAQEDLQSPFVMADLNDDELLDGEEMMEFSAPFLKEYVESAEGGLGFKSFEEMKNARKERLEKQREYEDKEAAMKEQEAKEAAEKAAAGAEAGAPEEAKKEL